MLLVCSIRRSLHDALPICLWNGIKTIFQGAWNVISKPMKTMYDKFKGWLTDLKDKAIDWGKNMIDGFIDGIKSMAGAVKDAAKNVISGIGDFLKFWSPAKKGEGRDI